jgi:hypothetical protein
MALAGDPTAEARLRRALTGAAAAVMITVYGAVMRAGAVAHLDHISYRNTVALMRRHQGFYAAFQQGFGQHSGDHIGTARAFRLPTMFLLWRWIPPSLLWPSFLVLVVGGTVLLLLLISDVPPVVLPVAAYLLMAGRTPSQGYDEWLLLELWALPAMVGCLVAWRRQRWWAAAGLALLAFLVRETAAPLLIGGLAASWRERERIVPWVVASGLAVVAYVAHLAAASHHLVHPGTDMAELGTGHPPASMLHMVGWMVPGPDLIGLAIWAVAVAEVWRRRELLLVGPVLAIPVLGLFVERPYWGLVVVPFVFFYAGEAAARAVTRASRSAGTAGAGSSPLPGTPTPAPGSPAAAAVPPSG